MAEYRIDIEKSAQNILDKIYERFGVSAERLVELAKADREGRCVLLPCKAGDTFRHNGLDYKADHWSVILSAFAKDRFAKTGKRICMFTVEDVAEKMAEEMEENENG